MIDFVDRKNYRFPRGTEFLCQGAVDGRDAMLRITHENDDICHLCCEPCLRSSLFFGIVDGEGLDSARINDGKGTRAGTASGDEPVPGHPRLIVDDSDPFAGEPIEQGRFSHVWATDNCYDWQITARRFHS
jgi:hypothetical protein